MATVRQNPEKWLAAAKATLHVDEADPRVVRILELGRKLQSGAGLTQAELAEEEELLQNELIDDYTKKYLSSETRK
ncbi:MAG TPA: hypothetical protein VN780_14830 [Candidatus Eisenbacteria bacterium]|jgi:hypothetical protein|nr:hypothetical protein [Candidatus Eisenbacteria bacterium]